MLLLLVEDLAHCKAGYSAFPDNSRCRGRVYNRRCSEPFRQRHRGPRGESDNYHVNRFPGWTLHEHAQDADPSSNRGELDMRASYARLESHRQNWETHGVVLLDDHASGRYPGDCTGREHSSGWIGKQTGSWAKTNHWPASKSGLVPRFDKVMTFSLIVSYFPHYWRSSYSVLSSRYFCANGKINTDPNERNKRKSKIGNKRSITFSAIVHALQGSIPLYLWTSHSILKEKL